MEYPKPDSSIDEIRQWLSGFEEEILSGLIGLLHVVSEHGNDARTALEDRLLHSREIQELVKGDWFIPNVEKLPLYEAGEEVAARYMDQDFAFISQGFVSRLAGLVLRQKDGPCACPLSQLSSFSIENDLVPLVKVMLLRIHSAALIVGVKKAVSDIDAATIQTIDSHEELKELITRGTVESRIRERLMGLFDDGDCCVRVSAIEFFLDTIVELTKTGQCVIIQRMLKKRLSLYR